MFINIRISSKNYNSIIKFLRFFSQKNFLKKLNIVLVTRTLQTKKQKKIFTVLKSPHVNKIAQESFNYQIYTKQFQVYSYQATLFLLILKKIKYYLFPDINFKISITTQTHQFTRKLKNSVNPDNFLLFNNNLSLKNYIKLFNNYGRLNLERQICLDSSVG